MLMTHVRSALFGCIIALVLVAGWASAHNVGSTTPLTYYSTSLGCAQGTSYIGEYSPPRARATVHVRRKTVGCGGNYTAAVNTLRVQQTILKNGAFCRSTGGWRYNDTAAVGLQHNFLGIDCGSGTYQNTGSHGVVIGDVWRQATGVNSHAF